MKQFQRNISLIGEDGQEKLNKSKVIVFGIGGVGGYVCEALARAGVGTVDVVDGDKVDETNINRQIIALHSTVGQGKAALMIERMLQINPAIQCIAMDFFYSKDKKEEINYEKYDYVVDAVDDVNAKLLIIAEAKKHNVPVISSMGTGNKLHPETFAIDDIARTSVCPLARVMRKKLKEQGIEHVDVLYSTEPPIKTASNETASISFVPSVAGLLIAGKVIRDLVKN